MTRTISFCEGCNSEMPPGRFCGECGNSLVEREVECTEGGDRKSAGGLSLFEQNALASQKAASSVSTVRDHKFAGQKPSAGYCGTFGDETRKKAQEATSAKGGYNKFGGTSSAYAGGFGDEQRKKAQAEASATGYNKFGGASGTGGYVGTFGDEQRKKAQAQSSVAGGYNKFSGQKPAAGGIDLVTAHNLETQKMMSEASRAKDSIVMSTEKKSEGAMDVVTASALKQQKETSSALKRQDKMIKTAEGTGEAPRMSNEPSYFCESCNEVRPQGKFCQECGSPLIVG